MRIDELFYWLALVLYSIGWLSIVAGSTFGRSRPAQVGRWVLLVAFISHTSSILSRWIQSGHGPVMRDFENALAGAWVVAGISLLVGWRREAYRPLLMAAIPVALVLLGFGLTIPQDLEPLSPTLKTPWLYIHVSFAWISFGAFTAASSAAAVFLLRAAGARRRSVAIDDAGLEGLDELQFRLIAYGFVASAVMIASGALWAKILWGTYWGWDPVETWSLASFIVYGLYIHLRLIFGWKMQRAAWVALFALIPVIVSFWGVGLMMTSRHLFQTMDLVR